MTKAPLIARLAIMPFLVVAHSNSVATDNVAEALTNCRTLGDEIERLECYDGIGKATATMNEQRAAEIVAVASEPESGSMTASSQSTEHQDDFGLPKKPDGPQSIRVTVESCGEASNRLFYFYLEDGQVWKYVGKDKLRIKSCEPGATIGEDRWGFSIQLDGDTRQLRVTRLR